MSKEDASQFNRELSRLKTENSLEEVEEKLGFFVRSKGQEDNLIPLIIWK